jgi:hypothetical protein
MREMEDYASPLVSLEEVQVRRIDIAQNFHDIAHPARYVLGLESVPRPNARKNYLYRGTTGLPQTLEAGSNAGWVRLYDKGLEDPGVAPPGTMRVEVEAHRGWAERYGPIYTTADLTSENVVKIFLNRMRWFGVENEVMTFETARKEIYFSNALGTRRKMAMVQYMYNLEDGKPPGVSKRTISDYKSILRDLGIGPMRVGGADRSITRLDLASGTEIRVA